VPKKVRDLKAMLRKAGFVVKPGRGSHTVWGHPAMTAKISLSGGDGDDAHLYQEKSVREMLRKLKEVQGE
jgi:predicted RNA binding protein YcfA (HicA-like mRNA interferase family)